MADVFKINGVTLDPTTDDFVATRFSERFGTIPYLTLQRRGIALPGLPDPWIGKEVTWEHDSVLYFTGDVVSCAPAYTAIGWVLNYQCLGFRNRLDWFPHTDNTSGIDTSPYNLTLEDPAYNPANAGRSVGDILGDVLTMLVNATAADGYGLGGYTSLSPPTLPTATTTDLAALDMIVPRPVYFTGEKLGSAIDGFLQQWAPNHRFWVDPDGVFRFMDLRTFTPQTLTMGTDPIEPTELSRDVGDCFQRVVVRGQPIAIMGFLKQSLGQLDQNFPYGSFLTNATAIASWNPNLYRNAGASQDVGTCTCPSTTTVTVTSSDAAVHWISNFWDQSTGQQGTINLYSTTVVGVTQLWSARIVSNTALTAGGTSTLTIDSPLPSTAYDHYTISGLSTGGSVVWTQYQIHDPALWDKVVRQSTYPQPFVSPGSGGATLISTALGVVLWSASGSPPYNSFPLAFNYNPNTGNIRFISPTYFIANNSAPSDVWVAIPLQTNPNVAIEPPDSGGPVYAGTSNTIDGLTKTLTIDAPYWRDQGQIAQVQAYASSVLDSVKDSTCEGAVIYYGFFTDALTFGVALNIAGNDGDGSYDTGWESLDLPVIGVDIEWPDTEGMDYRSTVHCSNRKQALSSAMFMHPEQQLGGGLAGIGETFNPFGISQPDTMSPAEGNYREMAQAALSGEISHAGLSTGNEIDMPDSGFDIGEMLGDEGGQEQGSSRPKKDRPALNSKADRQAAADARTKEDREERGRVAAADKQQAEARRKLGDTRLHDSDNPDEQARIASLGTHYPEPADDRIANLGRQRQAPPAERIQNLGKHEAEADDRIKHLGEYHPEMADERIANLGKQSQPVDDRIKNLGKPKAVDSDEADRIANLGKPSDDDDTTGGGG